MTYASAADVAALLARELTAEETGMVERRLDQVERMIIRRIPDLADRITSGSIDEADVVDIEAEAVLRVVLHGDGIVSESDGGFSYQKSYTADGTLRLIPEEWQTLGIRPSKMFTIVPNLVAPVRGSLFGMGG